MTPLWIKNGLALAKELEGILSKQGYTLTLAYGTLLGAVREGNIIKWDDDLDFSIIAHSQNPEDAREEVRNLCMMLKELGMLSKVFTKDGWLWYNEISKKEQITLPTGQIHVKDANVVIDLWIDFHIDGEYIDGFFGSFGDMERYYSDIQLKRYSFKVFSNPEVCLTKIYGDWKHPSKGKRGGGLIKNQYLLT